MHDSGQQCSQQQENNVNMERILKKKRKRKPTVLVHLLHDLKVLPGEGFKEMLVQKMLCKSGAFDKPVQHV
eukprot:4001770-Amphidinium_carterae.1